MNVKKLVKKLLPEPVLRILRRRRMRQDPKRTNPFGSHPGALDCCIAYNRHGGYCVPRSSLHRPVA